MNVCYVTGHAGQDAEERSTRSGSLMASFSVAVPNSWTDSEGVLHESTDWIRCVAFGASAQYAAAVRRGDKVHVEGRIQCRTYDDRDGNRRESVSVIVGRVCRLIPAEERPASRPSNGPQRRQDGSGARVVDRYRPPRAASQQPSDPPPSPPPDAYTDDSDIPF
jgi:single-strand DNA-binding protein